MTRNVNHGRLRWQRQTEHPAYRKFVSYFCGEQGWKDDSQIRSIVPPVLRGCKRPIVSIPDDHDYGMDNGNRYFEFKSEFARLFLRYAAGEHLDDAHATTDADLEGSCRVIPERGLHWAYRLYAKGSVNDLGTGVDVIMLDVHSHRETPCQSAAPYLKATCCSKDENLFYSFCNGNASNSSSEAEIRAQRASQAAR
jgi:hypothetical protein